MSPTDSVIQSINVPGCPKFPIPIASFLRLEIRSLPVTIFGCDPLRKGLFHLMGFPHGIVSFLPDTVATAASALVIHSAHALWVASFVLRAVRRDPTVWQDLYIAVFIDLWRLISSRFDPPIWPLWNYHIIFSLAVWFILYVLDKRSRTAIQSCNVPVSAIDVEPWTKPLVLPCRTTHTRTFPKKHSFSYSYLFVGIPVGWNGATGSTVSTGKGNKRGWLNVDASDHLERSAENLSLREKLDHYLQSQDVDSNKYPYVYLVTAPRILGYCFNPVSFWYLYSAKRELRAMILEVNNTFDERRIYLLQAQRDDSSQPNKEAQRPEVVEEVETGDLSPEVKFTAEWKKDFHVSPFNSREGSYTLLAHDPLAHGRDIASRISNTIKLISSEGHVKLVARVFSTTSPVDSQNCSFATKWWVLLRYGWTGFITFPRIVKEAKTLFFTRKLSVFFRPEVADSSIPRHATATEKFLETLFAQYLESLVTNSVPPCRVVYKPAPGTGAQQKVLFSSQNYEEKAITDQSMINFTVLSPGFYSRFVHYAHTAEALDREFLFTDARNQTLSVTNALALHKLLESSTKEQNCTERTGEKKHPAELASGLFIYAENLRWRLLRVLRCAPATPAYPASASGVLYTARVPRDIRGHPFSPLDTFVQHHYQSDSTQYRRKVTELFLAERFAAGFPVLVSIMDWICRALLSCYTAIVMPYWRTDLALISTGNLIHPETLLHPFLGIMVCNATHIWALLKGI